MRVRKAVRYQGKISSWKDDQGFGFITPNGDAAVPVFVHIKSFTRRGVRPALDAIVTYELGHNDKGQPRAEQVAFVGANATPSAAPPSSRGPLLVAVGFLTALAVAVFAARIPAFILYYYLASSVMTFLAYRRDKAAARAEQRRTPESTLHMLGLIGGWPGALLAQQLFRHKSKKESFREMLWITVGLNVTAFAWLIFTKGAVVLRMLQVQAQF